MTQMSAKHNYVPAMLFWRSKSTKKQVTWRYAWRKDYNAPEIKDHVNYIKPKRKIQILDWTSNKNSKIVMSFLKKTNILV